MLTKDFEYVLPSSFIAQTPATPRDSSRLMVVDRRGKTIQHHHFYDIIDYLSQGDLVVWNNTKVFKARLRGRVMLDESVDNVADDIEKKLALTDRIFNIPEVEIFLVRPTENIYVWRALAKPARKLRLGMKIVFSEDFFCEILLKEMNGTILVQFKDDDVAVRSKANMYGEVPTPPYIKALKHKNIKTGESDEDYQTVYAKSEGSVAAPTAGFHFTPELVEKLKNKGVEFAEVTLHVGLGTFQPVKTEKIEDHKMHSEWVELTSKNADLINQAKSDGRRIIAVGTTTVRVLEGIASFCRPCRSNCHPRHKIWDPGHCTNRLNEVVGGRSILDSRFRGNDNSGNLLKPYTGDINLFITPGFKFKIIDALITNFHLPKSTLLMLVSAYIGDREFMLDCYQKAIENNYRFYSFGDAMLIK